MGVTYVHGKVSNPRRADLGAVEHEFLIDTGAIYSVLPASELEALGVERIDHKVFTLADGTHQAYDVGESFFELPMNRGTARVIFAPEGVTPLIGVTTLEMMGLMVNPVTRELLPMRLLLPAIAVA